MKKNEAGLEDIENTLQVANPRVIGLTRRWGGGVESLFEGIFLTTACDINL